MLSITNAMKQYFQVEIVFRGPKYVFSQLGQLTPRFDILKAVEIKTTNSKKKKKSKHSGDTQIWRHTDLESIPNASIRICPELN